MATKVGLGLLIEKGFVLAWQLQTARHCKFSRGKRIKLRGHVLATVEIPGWNERVEYVKKSVHQLLRFGTNCIILAPTGDSISVEIGTETSVRCILVLPTMRDGYWQI